jgi:predicted nuclease with TOPRIM domain
VKEQLQERLAQLEQEYEKGQTVLRKAELERMQLEQTLIRIEGAMTVLRELLGETPAPAEDGVGDPEMVRVQ